jgi:serine/threonine protein kinase
VTPSGLFGMSVKLVLDRLGCTFATFDARSQDSGHISYGVIDADGRRWFVKTAGDDVDSPGGATRQERAAALRHAAALQEALDHPALVPLEAVIEASDGVLIVHPWFSGELLRSPTERRDDPDEAYSRFRALPMPEIAAALDTVIDFHVTLERSCWIAGDFYDGCLMYDFDTRQIKVIDLEAYHYGPYINGVGRLPGSTRFMAPEEHTRGALITARTTVYNLGRMLEIFLARNLPHPGLETVIARATSKEPERRPPSVAALQKEWRSSLAQDSSGAISGVATVDPAGREAEL